MPAGTCRVSTVPDGAEVSANTVPYQHNSKAQVPGIYYLHRVQRFYCL